MCKQNNFKIFLLFAIEMAVLSVFLQKKGLGPLGVNWSSTNLFEEFVKFLSTLINFFNFWDYFNTLKPLNIQNQIKSNKFYLFCNFPINFRDISWCFVLSIWLIRPNKKKYKENPKAPNFLKILINNYQTIV